MKGKYLSAVTIKYGGPEGRVTFQFFSCQHSSHFFNF